MQAIMKTDRFRKKLYRFTYDKPEIHRKALQFWHSLEEVKKLLEGSGYGKRRS